MYVVGLEQFQQELIRSLGNIIKGEEVSPNFLWQVNLTVSRTQLSAGWGKEEVSFVLR